MAPGVDTHTLTHTHTHTRTHTHTHTYVLWRHESDFKKPGVRRLQTGVRVPGLKIQLSGGDVRSWF